MHNDLNQLKTLSTLTHSNTSHNISVVGCIAYIYSLREVFNQAYGSYFMSTIFMLFSKYLNFISNIHLTNSFNLYRFGLK